jgi:hypothetical protein
VLGLSLKSLLPVAGAAAGFFIGGPAGSAAVNAALGSGIGTLLAGGDVKDAVKNAALAGIAGAGLEYGGVAGAGSASAESIAREKALGGIAGATETAGSQYVTLSGATPATATKAASKGIMSAISEKPLLTAALAGSAGALLGGGMEEEPQMTELQRLQSETGERVPGYEGRNIVLDYDYPVYAARGGYIEGPGTGRSDSIKSGIYQNGQKVQEARLSDGEFVMTERAVRGLGNGNRGKGAAKMYEMMRQYERMA